MVKFEPRKFIFYSSSLAVIETLTRRPSVFSRDMSRPLDWDKKRLTNGVRVHLLLLIRAFRVHRFICSKLSALNIYKSRMSILLLLLLRLTTFTTSPAHNKVSLLITPDSNSFYSLVSKLLKKDKDNLLSILDIEKRFFSFNTTSITRRLFEY